MLRCLPSFQGVKKPYNPVVGETFACAWDHKDGTRSQYFAEQVSHRPPMSATYFENREAGIVINCEVWTKSKFRAPQTAISAMIGGADVHLINRDERVCVQEGASHCITRAHSHAAAAVAALFIALSLSSVPCDTANLLCQRLALRHAPHGDW